jgi:hypothetical protein
MDETLKILLSVAFGALFFWVLSRNKKKSAKPDEFTAPVKKFVSPTQRKKTTVGKILADLEGSKKAESLLNAITVSKASLKNPMPLIKKEAPVSLSISEEKKLKEQIRLRAEGGKQRASEKKDDFNAEVDAEDVMNKERDKSYKLIQEAEHPIITLAKDSNNLQNAIILAEIMQKKH